MERILITPRSFGKSDPSVFALIKKAGYEPVINPYQQIMTKEQMMASVKDVVGIVIGVDPLDSDVLKNALELRAIAKYGVGTDNIDLTFCEQNNIAVSTTAGANANAVADYTFALTMAVARRLVFINELCHQKNWTKIMGNDIYGKRLGILGLGTIGKGVARRASGFEMETYAYDVFQDTEYAKSNRIKFASLDKIFEECDFISLHLPLTDETRHIINHTTLAKMKPSAILINTARGGLVDESALIDALKNKRIFGAGIDVFDQEPPANEELYQLDNLIMGSHCAASTAGASEMMSRMAAENLLKSL